jgi:hypothetical protein
MNTSLVVINLIQVIIDRKESENNFKISSKKAILITSRDAILNIIYANFRIFEQKPIYILKIIQNLIKELNKYIDSIDIQDLTKYDRHFELIEDLITTIIEMEFIIDDCNQPQLIDIIKDYIIKMKIENLIVKRDCKTILDILYNVVTFVPINLEELQKFLD